MVRIWLAMVVGATIVISSGVVASMARAQAGGDPAAVITAYEMARNRRDLDAALSYFADDATISQRTTTFTGKEEIRKFLDGVSNRSRFVVVSDRRTSGNHVTWTERSGGTTGQPQTQAPNALASGLAGQSGFAVSVEAVIQDGKIRSVSYLAANQVARPDPALDGRAQLPATVGLGAVGLLLLAVLVFASLGVSRSARGASTLRGRLMQDLQGWTAARQAP